MGIYGHTWDKYRIDLFENYSKDLDTFVSDILSETVAIQEGSFIDGIVNIGKKILGLIKKFIDFLASIPGKIMSLFRKKKESEESKKEPEREYSEEFKKKEEIVNKLKSVKFDYVDYHKMVESVIFENDSSLGSIGIDSNYHEFIISSDSIFNEKDIERFQSYLDKCENNLNETKIIPKHLSKCKNFYDFRDYLNSDELKAKFTSSETLYHLDFEIGNLGRTNKLIEGHLDFVKKSKASMEDTYKKVEKAIDGIKNKNYDNDYSDGEYVDRYIKNNVTANNKQYGIKAWGIYAKIMSIAIKCAEAREIAFAKFIAANELQENKIHSMIEKIKSEA